MSTPRWPYLDAPLPLAFAHRGGAAQGLENSMATFARAVEMGFCYLETDVRATADGVLLAFHDPTLDRVTDHVGVVRDLPYEVVARARIGGTEPIPLLVDVLGTWPDIRVNIDVKDAGTIGPVLDVLRHTDAWDRVCVGAFSDARIRAVRNAAGPRLATALGPREVLALAAAARTPRLDGRVRTDAPCVQVPRAAWRLVLVDERFVAAAHRQGRQVHVWTVDDPVAMNRLLDIGVDGLMSDDLETLLSVRDGRR